MGEATSEDHVRRTKWEDDLVRRAERCRHTASFYTIHTSFSYARMWRYRDRVAVRPASPRSGWMGIPIMLAVAQVVKMQFRAGRVKISPTFPIRPITPPPADER